MLHLRIRLPPVLARERDAKLRRREQQLDIFGPVLGQNRDAIPALHPSRSEGVRGPVHSLVQRGVGQGSVALLQRDAGASRFAPVGRTACLPVSPAAVDREVQVDGVMRT